MYAEVVCFLYVLMLKYKYDSNMNVLLLISFFINILESLNPFVQKTVLQNLYVSLERLKPYKTSLTLCNRDFNNWAET